MEQIHVIISITMYVLFVDLDGVLVDFKTGVIDLLGKPPETYEPQHMWRQLAGARNFYEYLPWMPEGKELWEVLRQYFPRILTGVPYGNWAIPQKRAWCSRELGDDVPVITCLSKQKATVGRKHAGKDNIPVLLDDRKALREQWEDMGGVFVHFENNSQALEMLARLGVIE